MDDELPISKADASAGRQVDALVVRSAMMHGGHHGSKTRHEIKGGAVRFKKDTCDAAHGKLFA